MATATDDRSYVLYSTGYFSWSDVMSSSHSWRERGELSCETRRCSQLKRRGKGRRHIAVSLPIYLYNHIPPPHNMYTPPLLALFLGDDGPGPQPIPLQFLSSA